MFDDRKEKLTGCVYTIFTPFDQNDKIDYESMEKYLTTLYRGGARKFYAMAYNSRYSQLSDDEIRKLNKFCIQFVKRLDKDNLVVVGDPIHCSTNTSISFADEAKEYGADFISLIVREKYFNDEQILTHFDMVARATGMAILVHEMPFLSGYDGTQMHWPVSLLKSLPKIPEIVALKEDAKDFDTCRAALELEPRIRVVIAGRKSSFIKFRPYGARAYLNGISIIDARIGERFWQAYENDDTQTVDFILRELEAPFFDKCCARFGWHRCNKAILEAAGFMSRRDRMPLPHLADDDFQLVQEVYSEIVKSLSRL